MESNQTRNAPDEGTSAEFVEVEGVARTQRRTRLEVPITAVINRRRLLLISGIIACPCTSGKWRCDYESRPQVVRRLSLSTRLSEQAVKRVTAQILRERDWSHEPKASRQVQIHASPIRRDSKGLRELEDDAFGLRLDRARSYCTMPQAQKSRKFRKRRQELFPARSFEEKAQREFSLKRGGRSLDEFHGEASWKQRPWCLDLVARGRRSTSVAAERN